MSGIAVVTVLVGFSISSGYLSLPNESQESEDLNGADEAEVSKVSVVTETRITELVNNFYSNLVKAIPPESNETAAQSAYDLLATEAKALRGEDMTLPSFIAYFAGVQEAPEQGFEVGEVLLGSEETYQVLTSWKYSSGNMEKIFYVVSVNDQYLIMAIL